MSTFNMFSKMVGAAMFTVAAADLLWKRFGPKNEDVVAGMTHFKKSAEEFQKGMMTVVFGQEKQQEEHKQSMKIEIQ